MAKIETKTVDGIKYYKDVNGLWANKETNPVSERFKEVYPSKNKKDKK